MRDINILAELSDMKMVDYKNTLAIVSLIEVLVEKGIINKDDIALKSKEIEGISLQQLESSNI